jgi:hypothetical protein
MKAPMGIPHWRLFAYLCYSLVTRMRLEYDPNMTRKRPECEMKENAAKTTFFLYIYAQNKRKTMKIYHFERNIRLFLSL